VLDVARDMARAKGADDDELLRKPLSEIAVHKPLTVTLPAEWFDDVRLYGSSIVEELVATEKLLRPQAVNQHDMGVWLAFMGILYGAIAERLGSSTYAAFKERERKKAQLTILQIALGWLVAPNFTEAMRKQAVAALRRLELSLADEVTQSSEDGDGAK
jgi:hypothetical protein